MSMAAHMPPPPLRDGDRLTSDEFMRRWEAMPDVKHAELIDGIVHMPSPVSEVHSDFHFRLNIWLGYYVAATPGCAGRPDMTWLMSKDGVPQPDLALKILPEHGGQSSVSGKYAAGAPELILEVGHSTFAKDSGPKLRLYERSGVREYVTLRPAKRQLTWRELVKGKYHEIEAGADGWLRSRVFPGLWLDPQALWNNDLPGLSAAVHRGVATEEHAAFLRELARRKR